MSRKTSTYQKWMLASLALNYTYTDLMLSRQAKRCSISTIQSHKFTAGKFMTWMRGCGYYERFGENQSWREWEGTLNRYRSNHSSALLDYRRNIANTKDDSPLLQSRNGQYFSAPVFLQSFRRISKRAGIDFSLHALRRTFVILSLRAGMDSLHLHALLGYASLDMFKRHALMVDDDLLKSHKALIPIDKSPSGPENKTLVPYLKFYLCNY